jgi:serralysin
MSQAPAYKFCKTLPGKRIGQASKPNTRAAALRASLWPEGTTIRVHFMEGDEGLRDQVFSVACEWLAANGGPANLHFEIVPSAQESDIRVTFRQGAGSWSYTGVECQNASLAGQATMNYGWLTPRSTDEEVRGVVLHEFGHAIGLIHEHQNPKQGIRWNRDAVVRDLSGPPNNWDPQTIINNVLSTYDPKAIEATEVDATSIMMYPIPAAWTDGTFVAGENNALSALDVQLVRELYPQSGG